jgi:hypothetical protein
MPIAGVEAIVNILTNFLHRIKPDPLRPDRDNNQLNQTRNRHASRQPLLAIEPVDPIEAGCFTLLPQQDEQPSIAEPPARIGEIAQLAAQLGIGRPAESIADTATIGGDQGAGPPLVHPEHCPQVSDSLALGRRALPFFCQKLAQRRSVEHRLSQQLLQLGIILRPATGSPICRA